MVESLLSGHGGGPGLPVSLLAAPRAPFSPRALEVVLLLETGENHALLCLPLSACVALSANPGLVARCSGQAMQSRSRLANQSRPTNASLRPVP